MRYEPLPPGWIARVDSAAVVRAALSGGRSVVLGRPTLAGDSLIGERLDAPGRARYAVALAEVEAVAVQRFDGERTGRAVWIALGVTALLTLAFIVVWPWLVAATEAT